MENNTTNSPVEKIQKGENKITTPVAIIVAGVLIMIGIILSNGGGANKKEKTLSEQLGIKKDKMTECIANFDKDTFGNKIFTSAEKATEGTKEGASGTPYNIIIGKNGIKTELRGAYPYEEFKKVIDGTISSSITNTYTGNVDAVEESDHILGSKDAEVVIIVYTDFECPYCKRHHATMNKLYTDYAGKVAFVYRHLPLVQLHPNAFEKAVASECVAQMKGNDAFWKYAEGLFNMIKTGDEPATDQL